MSRSFFSLGLVGNLVDAEVFEYICEVIYYTDLFSVRNFLSWSYC